MLNNILKALCCILVAALTPISINLWWNARLFMQQGQGAAQNVKNSTARADQYLDYQLNLVQSEPYQKSLRASFDTGAVYNATGRLINTQVLPRAMKDLDSLNALLISLDKRTETIDRLIVRLDDRLSGDSALLVSATALVQTLTQSANQFGVSLDTFNKMLVVISEKAGLTLDQVLALMSSPEWKQALASVTATTGSLAAFTAKADATMEQIRLAMHNAPEIAASLNKIAKESSRFAKTTLIVNILATIAKAFLP